MPLDEGRQILLPFVLPLDARARPRAPKKSPPPSIRRRLAILVLLAIVPVIAFSAFVVARYATDQRAVLTAQMSFSAHATASAVDSEIGRLLAVLTTLSTTPALQQHDLAAFYARASVAVAGEPGRRINLYDPSGITLVNTMMPYGSPLPPSSDQETIRRVAQTGAPAVSNLFMSPLTHAAVINVYVPVFQNDRVAYVLAMVVPPDGIQHLLEGQKLPAGWFLVLIDRTGTIVARTLNPEQTLGQPAVPGFVRAVRQASEGIVDTDRIEGAPVHLAFARAEMSGWTVGLWADSAVFNAPLRQSATVFAVGAFLLLGATYGFAMFYSRRISGPVATLSTLAEQVGRGESPAAVRLDLKEAQDAADQLHAAAEILAAHSAERESLLASLEQRVQARMHELAESEQRQHAIAQYARSLLEASLDPLVTISADGKITDVNEATIKATGMSREQLIGTDFSDYFTEPDKARAGYREVFEKGFVTDYPLTIRHKDGRLTDVLYNASVYRDTDGAIAGVFAAARDVSELKRTERELIKHREHLQELVEARTAELAKANALLTSTNKELESFAYSVSHDLRTPLRAIDGFSRVLLEDYRDKLDPEGQRILGVVRQGTDRMSHLIDDILGFSRVGRQEMRVAAIDMSALVADVVKDLEPATAGRQLTFDIKPLPPAHGDAAMIRRVWTNFLDNAIKFTKPKPDARIEVGATRAANETIYFVKDNGVGFDMQFANKLFGVFQRLHGIEEFPGTGIGLAIVKRIVDRHGGRVWGEGKVDGGATFYFALPDQGEKA